MSFEENWEYVNGDWVEDHEEEEWCDHLEDVVIVAENVQVIQRGKKRRDPWVW